MGCVLAPSPEHRAAPHTLTSEGGGSVRSRPPRGPSRLWGAPRVSLLLAAFHPGPREGLRVCPGAVPSPVACPLAAPRVLWNAAEHDSAEPPCHLPVSQQNAVTATAAWASPRGRQGTLGPGSDGCVGSWGPLVPAEGQGSSERWQRGLAAGPTAVMQVDFQGVRVTGRRDGGSSQREIQVHGAPVTDRLPGAHRGHVGRPRGPRSQQTRSGRGRAVNVLSVMVCHP